MWGGRRIRLCREGWYYVCVAAFIVGGAVLREVNLLVVLAGMLIGPLVFNWRFVTLTLRRFDVQRKLPERICAGDQLLVDLTAVNRRRRLGSWAVVVRDTVSLQPAAGRAEKIAASVIFPFVAARGQRATSYRCLLTRRGRYQFGPLRATTRFPLGLIEAATTIQRTDSLIVCPRLGRVTRHWAQMIEVERTGSQRSHRGRGNSEGDYYGLREWRAGDSQRWIHWRTSARLEGLAVRQFEQQRNRDVALLLDLWQPDQPGEVHAGHVELAVSFAATAVADLCRRGGGHVMMAVAGRGQRVWAPSPASQVIAREFLEQLAVVEAGEGEHLERILDEVRQRARPRTRIVVISTRGSRLDHARGRDEPGGGSAAHRVVEGKTVWIDVSGPQLATFFNPP